MPRSKLYLVARREYLENLRTKAFWIGILSFPLVLCLVTSAIFRNSRRHGQTLAIALVAYPVTRFLLEILRGDEMGQFGTGLTISQCFSLMLLTVGIAFSTWLQRQASPTPGTSTISTPDKTT